MLLLGRQFVLPGDFWLILGRNEQENDKLIRLAEEDDILLHMPDRPGPTALLRNAKSRLLACNEKDKTLIAAAGLVVRYGKKCVNDPGGKVEINGFVGKCYLTGYATSEDLRVAWMVKT